MPDPVALVVSASPTAYDLGEGHPMDPLRRHLALELIRAYGLADAPSVETIEAAPAGDDQITAVHATDYVEAVKRLGARPDGADDPNAVIWGLNRIGDTPAFPGMHEAAAAVCGGSIAAAEAVWSGRARRAFHVGGGLHHAMGNRAHGFCVYNDPAVAIRALLDAGAERVAYVDVDVHHGDGTQWLFYEDPRVLTASVHESGRYLFPGTGGIGERGVGEALGTAINIPLPPYAGDRPYLRAIEEVICPAVNAFRPDVIVTQDGADPHHIDPLAHLTVTMATFPRLYSALHDLADSAAGGRWVALGGGGYADDIVPRAWAMLFSELAGHPPCRTRSPPTGTTPPRSGPDTRCRADCSTTPSPRSPPGSAPAPTWRAIGSSTRRRSSSSDGDGRSGGLGRAEEPVAAHALAERHLDRGAYERTRGVASRPLGCADSDPPGPCRPGAPSRGRLAPRGRPAPLPQLAAARALGRAGHEGLASIVAYSGGALVECGRRGLDPLGDEFAPPLGDLARVGRLLDIAIVTTGAGGERCAPATRLRALAASLGPGDPHVVATVALLGAMADDPMARALVEGIVPRATA